MPHHHKRAIVLALACALLFPIAATARQGSSGASDTAFVLARAGVVPETKEGGSLASVVVLKLPIGCGR